MENAHFIHDHQTLIKLSGPGALALLQGQLTQDVNALTPGGGLLAAHCQAQGRVLSLFILFQTKDAYFLSLPNHLADIALNALKKYAVFYQVTLTLAPENINVVTTITTPEDTITALALAKAVLPGGITYLLSEGQALRQAIEKNHTPESLADYELSLIQLGIPALTPATSGEFVPHDLNLIALGAVSLSKGCYTGQEIITRMQHKAILKKHLHHATLSSPVREGDDVFIQGTEKIAGRVINAASTDGKTYHTLLLLDDAAIHETLTTVSQHSYQLHTKHELTHD